MNKSIIFAVIAFAAVVAAAPKPGAYSAGYPSAVYPSASYVSPVYVQPSIAYGAPSVASAQASAYASAARPGYLYNVNSYQILGGNSGYGYGHSPVYGGY